jgi:hypothetical protein
LALQPAVGFGLSKNTSPFFPIANSLHLLTPSTWRSLSTSSLYPFLGLPLRLVPSSSSVKIFLGILSSSILSRWPRQLILCPFIHFTIFSPLLSSSSSRFVLIFHSPSSYLGPYILVGWVQKLNILYWTPEGWQSPKTSCPLFNANRWSEWRPFKSYIEHETVVRVQKLGFLYWTEIIDLVRKSPLLRQFIILNWKFKTTNRCVNVFFSLLVNHHISSTVY